MAHTFVIFGASGDLTSRKLMPALYQLHRKKRLPADTRIVGFSRSPFSHDAVAGGPCEDDEGAYGQRFRREDLARVCPEGFLPRRRYREG